MLSSSSGDLVITTWIGSAVVCPAGGNQIALAQKVSGYLVSAATGSCGGLSAMTTNISTNGTCYTSVLTIPAVQALNGATVVCADGTNSDCSGK